MSTPVNIAVAGAGLIGKRHVEAIAASGAARLAAIVDPAPAAADYAASLGVPWRRSLAEMIDAEKPDGVILATPNQMHVEQGLACVAAGLPALVEKPIATDIAGALRLVEAAEAAAVPLLVGHHRRHNPLIAAAKAKLAEGALGRIVAVNAMFWLMKPEDYFDADWRRQPGAGPVFLNLIHDIDLLRHLCGEIVSVQAMESSAVRGFAVEDTAALLLRFASGALGTVAISDTVVAPWSWELTAAENPAYPATGQSCYQIGGTHGALELPNLRLWRNPGPRSWWAPIEAETIAAPAEDPLIRQIRHFAAVIRGEAAPLVPGREGLMTLAAVEAVKAAAATGGTVEVATILNSETNPNA
jgi:predicted dehydrogenase